MTFNLADFLLSLSTVHQGASGRSVTANMSSLAREYASHLVIDSRSVSDSFHRRIGSFNRDLNRCSCSSSDTENQYLSRMMPSSTSIRSSPGTCRKNSSYCSGVQYPSTCSTPARLYQERSISTISPFVGSWAM